MDSCLIVLVCLCHFTEDLGSRRSSGLSTYWLILIFWQEDQWDEVTIDVVGTFVLLFGTSSMQSHWQIITVNGKMWLLELLLQLRKWSFLSSVFSRFGQPSSVVFDNGSQFTSVRLLHSCGPEIYITYELLFTTPLPMVQLKVSSRYSTAAFSLLFLKISHGSERTFLPSERVFCCSEADTCCKSTSEIIWTIVHH